MEAEMEAEKEFQDREDKKKQLFQDQKQLLDTFLEHGAISQTQYDKSLGDLIVKMGIDVDGCGSGSFSILKPSC